MTNNSKMFIAAFSAAIIGFCAGAMLLSSESRYSVGTMPIGINTGDERLRGNEVFYIVDSKKQTITICAWDRATATLLDKDGEAYQDTPFKDIAQTCFSRNIKGLQNHLTFNGASLGR